ncbi:hypothetical protein RhiirA1_461620 [Rhizophagus irregularis]|uniref:Uncharacterized protein n=1 Tax=Rhizophagus irregularis TaxID=588596 RepID=A0A2I1ENI6_9GLOM|nr:hypothetical protein RhiirA1_461620 [Rhizophagus irregularis]PKY23694.1 hypothetical protein RhiirB3_437976 [Rhizophagus irregularis]CAB4475046.1 unnamed protein product [Rhizophagus irregularis]CAB5094827.1 unnamed protein product [Rhizophagus irregularis]CAB5386869.1 unnamed protein product [Rhizophagus irregularis]
MSDIDTFDSANQVSAQTTTFQPIQDQLVELSLFYQPQNDNSNIYHITCRKITQDHLQGTGNSDDNYDYEFFIESLDDFTTTFHVTCKLLPNFLILNILNKEIYGFDFDVTELRRRYLLTLHQKLNLERNLRQILPSYFSTSNS